MKKLHATGWTSESPTPAQLKEFFAQIESGRITKQKLQGFLSKKVKVKHMVDLGAPPRLPFDGAKVVKHEGEGVVEIELRSDDNLYVDGKLVSLSLSERQKGNKRIIGHELRQEIEDGSQILLNSNVLDYLYDHPELFPEHWKKYENGVTHYIFFWGSIFRNPARSCLYARFLCWLDGELNRDYRWLDHDWARRHPSASVAS